VSIQTSETDAQEVLRLRALARLTGNGNAANPRANSAAALGALYELASCSATTADALALLHEIQVHQVEVELQDEELRQSRAELEAGMARFIHLYDLAPFGYFTVDDSTSICEVNLAGARLLGSSRDALLGRPLEQLLVPESPAVLRAMLADTRNGAEARTRTVRLADQGTTRALHARASADAMPGRYLIALMEVG
jgi:PAS domain S-box-containing protein